MSRIRPNPRKNFSTSFSLISRGRRPRKTLGALSLLMIACNNIQSCDNANLKVKWTCWKAKICYPDRPLGDHLRMTESAWLNKRGSGEVWGLIWGRGRNQMINVRLTAGARKYFFINQRDSNFQCYTEENILKKVEILYSSMSCWR